MSRSTSSTAPWRRYAALALCVGGSVLTGALPSAPAHADPGTPEQQQLLSFDDFSSVEGLQLLGNAHQSGDVVRLTDATNGQTGVLWSDRNLDPAQDFSTDFVLNLHGSTSCPADGIDFVVQGAPEGNRARGENGGAMGYGGISPSFAAEFDIFGGNGGDPNANHVGFLTNGDPDNSNYPGDWTNTLPGGPSLYGDGPVHAWLDYDATSHVVRLFLSADDTKPSDPVLDVTHDISSDITTHSAFVGFTAATGACNAAQDVVSWNATGVPGESNDTLTLTADPASPNSFGKKPVLTATVQPSAADAPVPTGAVDFVVDGTRVGTAQLNEQGVATLALKRRFKDGLYQLRADYAGDGVADPATDSLAYQVGAVPPAVTVHPASSTIAYGTAVTASVVGPQGAKYPTGSVSWYTSDSSAPIAKTRVGDRVASLPVSTLTVGDYDLTAVYTPDSASKTRYVGASSDAVHLVVVQASSTTTLSSSPSPVQQGSGGSLFADVAATTSSKAVVTGSVTFYDTDGSKLGTAKVAAGRAKLPTRKLSVGDHQITAEYSGDANVSGSSDTRTVQVVAPTG